MKNAIKAFTLAVMAIRCAGVMAARPRSIPGSSRLGGLQLEVFPQAWLDALTLTPEELSRARLRATR